MFLNYAVADRMVLLLNTVPHNTPWLFFCSTAEFTKKQFEDNVYQTSSCKFQQWASKYSSALLSWANLMPCWDYVCHLFGYQFLFIFFYHLKTTDLHSFKRCYVIKKLTNLGKHNSKYSFISRQLVSKCLTFRHKCDRKLLEALQKGGGRNFIHKSNLFGELLQDRVDN